ncbi:Hypothetical predicted protein, partial [Pelobates cultripes]
TTRQHQELRDATERTRRKDTKPADTINQHNIKHSPESNRQQKTTAIMQCNGREGSPADDKGHTDKYNSYQGLCKANDIDSHPHDTYPVPTTRRWQHHQTRPTTTWTKDGRQATVTPQRIGLWGWYITKGDRRQLKSLGNIWERL